MLFMFFSGISTCLSADEAKQPKMKNALIELEKAKKVYGEPRKSSLEAAKKYLQEATEDKGGHRIKAIKTINDALTLMKDIKKGTKDEDSPKVRELIDNAINEVKAGIAAGAMKK